MFKLEDYKLFDNISEESKSKIKSLHIESKNFDSCELVLKKGTRLDHVLIIEKGCLKTSEYMIDGKEIVSSYYWAGDAFPFYLYFGNTKEFPYDVCTTKKTIVHFLPLREFEKIMDQDIILTKNIMKFIAEYTCFNKLIIRSTQYTKVSQRLAYWILHLNEVDRLKLPSTQSMLADMLRVNRPSLNQELKAFEDMGLIRRKGMNIDILDRTGLIEIID